MQMVKALDMLCRNMLGLVNKPQLNRMGVNRVMSINKNEGLKKIMTLKDYQEYLEAIEWEDFFQIEKILKKYDIKMVVK